MIRNVCFNTQPPEGGWVIRRVGPSATSVSTHSRPKAAGLDGLDKQAYRFLFQHTAARRRLVACWPAERRGFMVSTHSRPKAAGLPCLAIGLRLPVSTHSRPKAAGSSTGQYAKRRAAFQHTAARRRLGFDLATNYSPELFQHTAARRRLARGRQRLGAKPEFQHTAARRRLVICQQVTLHCFSEVSTHSRPKAAGSLFQ